MDRTAAVIAEFNPLHNGHRYFLDQVRKLSGARYILVVMSGDFVQRGVPAIYDKYTRTSMALAAGADAVIELPLASAAGSAGRFAAGAIAVLQAAGAVDELWFGSESGDDQAFSEVSSLLLEESPDFQSELQGLLKSGITWPAARMEALRRTKPSLASSGILDGPNNTLGLEYCMALRRAGSPITPHTILRTGEAHDAAVPYRLNNNVSSTSVHSQTSTHSETNAGISESFASASSLRALLEKDSDPMVLRGMVPEETLQILTRHTTDAATAATTRSADAAPVAMTHSTDAAPAATTRIADAVPVTEEDFSSMLIYQLMKETPDSLTRYLDVSDDLARRICHLRSEFRSFRQFADLLKTRNTTRTQVNRALIHILLGITQEDYARFLHPKALRLLGFRTASTGLLTQIKANGTAPLLAGNALLPTMYDERDLVASDLYEYVHARKSGQPFTQEFRHPLIRWERESAKN